MSNPTFVQGPITFEAGAPLEKFTLVDINEDGKVVPSAGTNPFGAVTEKADPDNTALPNDIAVHYGPAAVKLRVDGGDATAIKAGSAVYASSNGRVAAAGSVPVGIAVRDGSGDRVLTVLSLLPSPAAASSAGEDE